MMPRHWLATAFNRAGASAARYSEPARRGRRRKAMILAAACLAVGQSGLPATASLASAPRSDAEGKPPEAAARPNFLIIVADDLGFADVGFNGATMPTPNIDRIATMGMRLDHFYVTALCSPSRAGLLTGRYPHRFGIMGETITPGSTFGMDPSEVTIAQTLAQAGYERRSFLGKWHLGHRSLQFHPMHFGFTSFYGHYNGAIDYFTHKREGEVDWHRDYKASPDKGYSTDLLTKEAVRIIRTPSPHNAPWLMWVAYNAPHGPLQATEQDLAAVGFDPSKPRFKLHESKRESPDYGEQGRGNTHRQTELAAVHGVDRGVGQILDALEQTGQLDNTVILFTSDNGGPGRTGARDNPSNNGPLRGWKFLHFEGGVRVAAAIAWPGHLKPRGEAGVGPVAYIDILPTFAKLAGAPLKKPVDGEDVSAALLSGTPLPERSLFLGEDYRIPPPSGERGPTYPEAMLGRTAAARDGRWKIVGDQLFDLQTDPYEKHDVSADHPALAEKLKKQAADYSALRRIPRARMNDAKLPPIPLWQLENADKAGKTPSGSEN